MLDRYTYRGRHRAPSSTARTAAGVAVVGAVAATPLAMAAPAYAAAPAEVLDIIAQCESGDRNVESVDPHSSASGHWQFVDGTWRLFGGGSFSARAIGASRAEQLVVAERAFAANGLADWEASRSCWQPRVAALGGTSGRHAAPTDAGAVVTAPAASAAAPRHAAPDDTYTVVRGDTLGEIAADHGTTARALFAENRAVIGDDIDLILPGQVLRV